MVTVFTGVGHAADAETRKGAGEVHGISHKQGDGASHYSTAEFLWDEKRQIGARDRYTATTVRDY